MKNLYNKKTKKIHPSPPPQPLSSTTSDHLLSLLPAALLTLTVALSNEDKQVLAYLISCSSKTLNFSQNIRGEDQIQSSKNIVKAHDLDFNCDCFNCYMSFWARWDVSPNREMIHDIIEAYEEDLFKKKKQKKKKKKDGKSKNVFTDQESEKNVNGNLEKEGNKSDELFTSGEKNCDDNNNNNGDEELEKTTVRKITSFLGEKIWGIWSRD